MHAMMWKIYQQVSINRNSVKVILIRVTQTDMLGACDLFCIAQNGIHDSKMTFSRMVCPFKKIIIIIIVLSTWWPDLKKKFVAYLQGIGEEG